MALLKNIRRLRADSLLELIIAAVLVSVIFSIAMMVYSNVLHSSRSVTRLKAAAILKKTAQRIEQTGDTTFADTTRGIRVRCVLIRSDTGPTAHLHLVALGEQNDTLALYDKIILWNEK